MTDEERMRRLDKVYVPAKEVLEAIGLEVEGIQDVFVTANTDWVDDRKSYTVTIEAVCMR